MQLKSHTFVATPAYRGDVVMQYAHSIVRDSVAALGQFHLVEAPYFIGNTYIHIARNAAVQKFLGEEGYDFLFFIDADMGWQPNAIAEMLELPREWDVVGGVYRTKDHAPRYPFNPLPNIPVRYPVCEVAGVATGFMRITKACLERTVARFGKRLFDHIIDEACDVEWGDDLAFCKRVRAAGGRVYGKFDIEFEHVGPYAWRGRACDHMATSEGFVLPEGVGPVKECA